MEEEKHGFFSKLFWGYLAYKIISQRSKDKYLDNIILEEE